MKMANNNFVTAMLAIMAGITGGAVVADYMATKKYEASLVSEWEAQHCVPSGRRGLARVYARDQEQFEWADYMSAVEWLDPEWKSFEGEGVTIEWEPIKYRFNPHTDNAEAGFEIVVTLNNGKKVTHVVPAREEFN